ncbi:MAG: YfiR family protein [Fulvivirga sp.]|uniref:YfiR family protein n=1 Tax=Fulvivirga sp. TaxID=1931237 RepID=UPI0032EB6967
MKKLNFLTAFILMWAISMPLLAQNAESKIKTLFVYNFTRYIQWPNSDGNVTIGILGNDEQIVAAFKEMAAKKSSPSSKIIIEVFTDASKSGKYELVYIPESNSHLISSVSKSAKTVVVSEKPGMTQKGSDINFVHKDGKIRFELNKKSIDNSQFKVASQLVSLAIVV